MTRKEFIKVLEEKEYSYEIQGDKIVVTHDRNVYLHSLTSLPPGVVFRNGGSVDLDSLTSLPSGVVFRNEGNVNLKSLIGWMMYWRGTIKGIDPNRLLNKMISLGLFEKKR